MRPSAQEVPGEAGNIKTTPASKNRVEIEGSIEKKWGRKMGSKNEENPPFPKSRNPRNWGLKKGFKTPKNDSNWGCRKGSKKAKNDDFWGFLGVF